MTDRDLRSRLVGSWTLVWYEIIDPTGPRRRPFGEAVGRLTYDALGNMSGQVMRPARPRVGRSAANAFEVYNGYIAYFGTYRTNDTGDIVVHSVQGALNPSWVGGEQVRRVRFEGGNLVLSADVPRGDATETHVLTWQRLTAADTPSNA